MKKLLLVLGLMFGVCVLDSAVRADGPPAAGSATTAGSGSAAQPTAENLPNPVQSPGAAFDELKAAKKLGWAVLAFVVLVFAAKAAGTIGSSVSWVSWLAKGKAAVVIGGIGATAAGCYNAAVDGGSWTAIGFAGAIAIAHYLDASPAERASS